MARPLSSARRLAILAVTLSCAACPAPPGDDGGEPPIAKDAGEGDLDAGPDAGTDVDAGPDAGAPAVVPGWWRADVPFRIPVEGLSETPAGHTAAIVLDHAALIAAGRSLASGADVHVVARTGGVWWVLPRAPDPIRGFGRADTTLWLRAPGESELFVYFGNPAVTTANATYDAIFLVGDAFDDGSLAGALVGSVAGEGAVLEEGGSAVLRAGADANGAAALSLALPDDGFELSARVGGSAAPDPMDEVRLLSLHEGSAPLALGDDAEVRASTRLTIVHRANGALLIQRWDADGNRMGWDGSAWVDGDALWAAVTPGASFVLRLSSTDGAISLEVANVSGEELTATEPVPLDALVDDGAPLSLAFGEPLVEQSFGEVSLDWLLLRASASDALTLGAVEGPSDPRCDDGEANGDESDVDCGGSCGVCDVGATCAASLECTTGYCAPSATCELTTSCADLLEREPGTPSGTYVVDGSAGPATAFCEMERASGGWTRVTVVDANDPEPACPDGWTLLQDERVCAAVLEAQGERSALFDVPIVEYGEVMGFVRGHGAGTPDAFGLYHVTDPSLDDPYVDGVSITTPAPEREHVWTYAATHTGTEDTRNACPCRGGYEPATFVGGDFFCGTLTGPRTSGWALGSALWARERNSYQCDVGEAQGWFTKLLSTPRGGPLEVRLLMDEPVGNEDIGISRLELYVR